MIRSHSGNAAALVAPACRRTDTRRAFVLLAILVLVLVGSMIAIGVLYRMRAEAGHRSAALNQAQAFNTILSGINRAIAVVQEALQTDRTSWYDNAAAFRHQLLFQSGGQSWYFTIFVPEYDQNGTLIPRFGLSDEASRLFLPAADPETVSRLCDLDMETAQRLIQASRDVRSSGSIAVTHSEPDGSSVGSGTHDWLGGSVSQAGIADPSGAFGALSWFEITNGWDSMSEGSASTGFLTPEPQVETDLTNQSSTPPATETTPASDGRTAAAETTAALPETNTPPTAVPLVVAWLAAGLPESLLEGTSSRPGPTNSPFSDAPGQSLASLFSRMEQPSPTDGSDELSSPGAAASQLLTTCAYEPNVDHQGRPRINLNDPELDVQQLELPEETKTFLAALKQAGRRLNHVADLLEAEETFTDERGRQRRLRSGIGRDQLADLLDRYTTTDAPYLVGLINVNTAPLPVLMSLPGITEEIARQIIDMRQSLTIEERRTPAWLYTRGIVDAQLFRQLAPRITTRSYQFRFRVVAYALPSQVYRVAEVMIDLASDVPRVIYYRDVTRAGLALDLATLTGQEAGRIGTAAISSFSP